LKESSTISSIGHVAALGLLHDTGQTVISKVVEEEVPRIVLVVEDDRPTAELLATAIEGEHGYRAVRAETVDEALAALRRVRPDIVLVDLRLPGRSGLDLYDEVRRDPRYAGLPVVVETAVASEHGEELRRRGVATYLRKPFDIDEVVRFIRHLVPASP
jgi:two-component system response regulator GlrR